MVNKCKVFPCKSGHKGYPKCRIFSLPKEERERNAWIDRIPPRKDFELDPEKFYICELHWPPGYDLKKVPGGTRPADPPSIFPEVPESCLPTPKTHRTTDPSKFAERQMEYLKKKDEVKSLDAFKPEKDLRKIHKDIIITRTSETLVCVFMKEDFSDCELSIVIEKQSALTSPLTLKAYKRGFRVPLGGYLHPNNGFNSLQMFLDAVNQALKFEPDCTSLVEDFVGHMFKHQQVESECCANSEKQKKMNFLTHQLHLVCKKHFTLQDYCFALETYPSCKYEHMREYLVLPSKRKLQSVMSSVDIDSVLKKTFEKIAVEQQKNVLLLVDEVKIRPTVSFAGGIISGMAKNREDCRATSMLCVMLKSLHKGPSVMISVTPVHRLDSDYQFSVVREAAVKVERAGGRVIGSITDNHKVNQQYCEKFAGFEASTGKAEHPLDPSRVWFLLFDTVHILKCIRNNWITEKITGKTLTINGHTASFDHVIKLYEKEKDHILKTTTLTRSSVYPSRLQLQNVQHVLKVFNEKTVAALRMEKGCEGTANFIQLVLNFWNMVNVSRKGLDQRFNDPSRAVQEKGTPLLHEYLQIFTNANAGQGNTRNQCLTHDTKKAIVQTLAGLKGVCEYLMTTVTPPFDYVVLRELQSDRIEGEFGVYRQSFGANAFMTCGDVFAANKKRLARYAAVNLQDLDLNSTPAQHACVGDQIDIDDAEVMEICGAVVDLTDNEISSAAYVAGWLERKCTGDISFSDDDELLEGEAIEFLIEISRGQLVVPHVSTFHLVCFGLSFVKQARHRACCRNRLTNILKTMASFNLIEFDCTAIYTHLSNVLLNGLQKLERDQDKDSVLLQTSLKKARML